MADGRALAVVRRIYEAFDRGDIDYVLGVLDPQVEWNEAEHVTFWSGAPFVGPDAVVTGLFARIPSTFGRTWSILVERLYGCEDTVIMQGRYRSTHGAGHR